MRAVSQTFIDEFLKQADSAVRERTLIQFIIAGYENDRDRFHDVFLQSRFMLKMRDEDIQIIIAKLREFSSEEVVNTLVCMNWLKCFICSCDGEIKRLIKDEDISAEELLYYYEKLVVKYKSEGKFFDDVPPQIATSQFEFFDGNFGGLIEIITKNAVPFKNAIPKQKSHLKQIINLILQKESAANIRRHII